MLLVNALVELKVRVNNNYWRMTMTKKIKPQDNESNMKNSNKGTDGTNKQYDQVHGNKGKQKNPNQKKSNP